MKSLREIVEEFQDSDASEKMGMIAKGADATLAVSGFLANLGIAAYKGFTDQPFAAPEVSTILQGAIIAHSSVSSMIRAHRYRLYKGHASYTPLNNFFEQGIGTPVCMTALAGIAYWAGKTIKNNL